jgi:hypothetical protein
MRSFVSSRTSKVSAPRGFNLVPKSTAKSNTRNLTGTKRLSKYRTTRLVPLIQYAPSIGFFVAAPLSYILKLYCPNAPASSLKSWSWNQDCCNNQRSTVSRCAHLPSTSFASSAAISTLERAASDPYQSRKAADTVSASAVTIQVKVRVSLLITAAGTACYTPTSLAHPALHSDFCEPSLRVRPTATAGWVAPQPGVQYAMLCSQPNACAGSSSRRRLTIFHASSQESSSVMGSLDLSPFVQRTTLQIGRSVAEKESK